MPITLNSPKLADPKSLAYQMHKKQQDRKRRKNPFVPELFERYFRRNEGTTDYATIPEVTLAGDFVIEFDLLVGDSSPNVVLGNSSSASNVIFTNAGSLYVRDSSANTVNAGAITDNILHSIEVSRTLNDIAITIDGVSLPAGPVVTGFTFDWLYEYASNFPLNGILANLKIYDNGTLIRDYPLDDNSNTLRDRTNGQSGTVINGNASDWGLFQQQATGEWLGQELSLISSTGLLGDDSDPEFAVVAFTADIGSGLTYRVGAVFDSYTGTSDAGFTSSLSGMPAEPPFRATLASAGDFVGGDWLTTASGGVSLFGRAASVSSFINVTLKEVLNVA